MKKTLILLLITLSFFCVNKVFASEYCHLNNLRADYTYKENFKSLKKNKTLDKNTTFFYYYINISGLNSDNYLIITNNYNKDKKTINSDEIKNGLATYEWTVFNKEVEFTIDVYTNDENCINKKIKTLKIITPKLNHFYLDYECRKIPEFEMCQPFNENDLNYSEFYESVNLYRKKHHLKPVSEFDTSFIGKTLDFLKNNICFSTVCCIVVIGIVFIIINKNKLKKIKQNTPPKKRDMPKKATVKKKKNNRKKKEKKS